MPFKRIHLAVGVKAYLTLDEHVEEVFVWLGVVSAGHQVPEYRVTVLLVEPQSRETAPARSLVVKATALGGGHHIQELVTACGGHAL